MVDWHCHVPCNLRWRESGVTMSQNATWSPQSAQMRITQLLLLNRPDQLRRNLSIKNHASTSYSARIKETKAQEMSTSPKPSRKGNSAQTVEAWNCCEPTSSAGPTASESNHVVCWRTGGRESHWSRCRTLCCCGMQPLLRPEVARRAGCRRRARRGEARNRVESIGT